MSRVQAPALAARAATHTVPAWSLAVPVAVVLIAAIVAAGMVVLSHSAKTPWVASGTAKVGGAAPDFSSWDLSGSKVGLDDYRGRPVLLTFWATSCTACQDEFPELQAIESRYRPNGLAVLAVDYRETSTQSMERFLNRLGVDFRAVIDPQGTIAWAYQVVIGLPVNVWLDRGHVVAQMMLGAKPAADLGAAAAAVAG